MFRICGGYWLIGKPPLRSRALGHLSIRTNHHGLLYVGSAGALCHWPCYGCTWLTSTQVDGALSAHKAQLLKQDQLCSKCEGLLSVECKVEHAANVVEEPHGVAQCTHMRSVALCYMYATMHTVACVCIHVTVTCRHSQVNETVLISGKASTRDLTGELIHITFWLWPVAEAFISHLLCQRHGFWVRLSTACVSPLCACPSTPCRHAMHACPPAACLGGMHASRLAH